ncbi:uncharacterized protein [Primulina eburnea]|uniref:uncharacterized protein n=1 Tax=Primulina eburnea TaxID=1245227 RepID=UPI003C6C44C5
MTQYFSQFAGNNVGVDTGARPGLEALYERFRRMDPKEFSGTTDPIIAEGWIKSIEGTLIVVGERVFSVNLHTLSWDGFKEVLYSKYFIEEVCSRLTREFTTLRQGDCSVEDFVRRFERGCNFVPLIANDSLEKLKHFIDVLRPIFRCDVRVAGPTTYVIVVTRALAAEQDQKDIDIDIHGNMPYQAPQQHHSQQQQFKRPF